MKSDSKLLLSAFSLLIVLILLENRIDTRKYTQSDDPVTFVDVKMIFKDKCKQCHFQPDRDWTNYDIAFKNKDKIKYQVWTIQAMPVGGNITKGERELIKDWVDQGAKK